MNTLKEMLSKTWLDLVLIGLAIPFIKVFDFATFTVGFFTRTAIAGILAILIKKLKS